MGFGWFQVPAHGFKPQSEVHGLDKITKQKVNIRVMYQILFWNETGLVH